MEARFKVEIKTLDKPARIPKEKLEEFKGVLSRGMINRMKREAVNCPVQGKTVPFLECFTCEKFIRRVKGEVHCKG
ncbi:MAG: hypothetical protein DRO46_02985 [Candidatus Hecatellales archaeon]|nr:MAG: hypothetical protein DRO46_02985 [Candidatus Hecatellales archaeon]